MCSDERTMRAVVLMVVTGLLWMVSSASRPRMYTSIQSKPRANNLGARILGREASEWGCWKRCEPVECAKPFQTERPPCRLKLRMRPNTCVRASLEIDVHHGECEVRDLCRRSCSRVNWLWRQNDEWPTTCPITVPRRRRMTVSCTGISFRRQLVQRPRPPKRSPSGAADSMAWPSGCRSLSGRLQTSSLSRLASSRDPQPMLGNPRWRPGQGDELVRQRVGILQSNRPPGAADRGRDRSPDGARTLNDPGCLEIPRGER